MDIRFVSSLTSEDEKLFAPALLKAVAALLDQLPIAYTLRIETTGSDVFQHTHAVSVDEAKASIMRVDLRMVVAPFRSLLALLRSRTDRAPPPALPVVFNFHQPS